MVDGTARGAGRGVSVANRIGECEKGGDAAGEMRFARLGRRLERFGVVFFGRGGRRGIVWIDGPEALMDVRAWKKEQKAAGKSKQQ